MLNSALNTRKSTRIIPNSSSLPALSVPNSRTQYPLGRKCMGLHLGRPPAGPKALEPVSNISPSELPVIPGVLDAAENLRRVAALRRELSRLCGGKKYFLTCRDAAKAWPGSSHQKAYNINLALAQLGVIEVVRAGDPHLGGRASYYRYLLPQSRNGKTAIAA